MFSAEALSCAPLLSLEFLRRAAPLGAALLLVPLAAAVANDRGPMWRGEDEPQPNVEGFTAPGYEAVR